MLLDAKALSRFYATAEGGAVRRTIAAHIESLWPSLRSYRVLGYGYAPPYLEALEAERTLAFMPASQGAVAWPADRPRTVLGSEAALPFADAFFDRILVVHGLETAENTRHLLRQLWRILAPEGRMIVVVPNRVSVWALLEASPFACGRPFRHGELDVLLRETLFEPVGWTRALYRPPRIGRRSPRAAAVWEQAGRTLFPGLAGVLIAEVKKTVFGLTPLVKAGARATVFVEA